MGNVKHASKDYMSGHIERNGQVVVEKVFGNYMGYLDFDNKRYFDARELEKTEVIDLPLSNPYCLSSDSRNRPDIVSLNEEDSE
jgi:hypothetical protein